MSSVDDTVVADRKGEEVTLPFSAEQLAWIDRLISARYNALLGDSRPVGGNPPSSQPSSSGVGEFLLVFKH